MVLVYIVAAIVVMIRPYSHTIPALKPTFEVTLSPEAVLGDALGITVKMTITKGVGRGLFPNEVDMSSTPYACAAANVAHPVL